MRATGPERPHPDMDATQLHDEGPDWQDAVIRAMGVKPTPVQRVTVQVSRDQFVSGLRWGSDAPRVVLVHGGGQNAHTWNAVAVSMGMPTLAIDLPGHGSSSWRADQDYTPWRNAEALAATLDQLDISADLIVGMSLGGLSAIRLRAMRPDLVKRLALVDVTPASGIRYQRLARRDRGAIVLLDDERVFNTFEDMLAAAVAAAPNRDPAILARGVRRNAKQLSDGRWTWKYDDLRKLTSGSHLFVDLWPDLAAGTGPVLLAVAENAGIVTAEDEIKFAALVPRHKIRHFPTDDHSIQSSHPAQLAKLFREYATGSLD